MTDIPTFDFHLPDFKTGMDQAQLANDVKKLKDYVYMLNEQLRYQFSHIDDENIADGSVTEDSLGTDLKRKVMDAEGNYSIIKQTANAISLEVASDKVYRAANETALLAQLAALVPPLSLAAGMLWLDTTNSLIKRCTSVGPPIVWGNVQTDEVHTSYIDIAADLLAINSGGRLTITSPTTLAITSGATNAAAIAVRNDTDYFISAGHLTQSSAPFWVKKDGSVKATAGTIGGFTLSSGILQDTSSSGGLLKLSPAGGYILMGGRLQLYTDENDHSYIHHTATDGTILFLQNTSSSIELFGRQSSALRVGASGFSYPTVSVYTELYVSGTCSALSFYDFTPSYSGNALSELALVADKDGDIDHSTLPVAAQVTIKRRVVKNGAEVKDGKGNFIEYDEAGRDIGMMVSILTKGIQELVAVNDAQNARITKLEETVISQQKQIDQLLGAARIM